MMMTIILINQCLTVLSHSDICPALCRHPNGNGKHTSSGKPRKLLDQVRDRVRTKHYSIRTEEAYVGWIRRFVLFHNKQHPREMGKRDIESFLTYLAVDSKVSASTQSQALSALLFLYRDVLDLEFPQIEDVTRAKPPQRLLVETGETGETGTLMTFLYSLNVFLPLALMPKVANQRAFFWPLELLQGFFAHVRSSCRCWATQSRR